MNWQIEKGIRCDLACYAAKNLVGQRHPVRIFPKGNRQGDVPTKSLYSLLIRAPYGTRVIFQTATGTSWEKSPWRCIRLTEEHSLKSAGVGNPGIYIPDLDFLDGHGDKRTSVDTECSYSIANTLAEGKDWTFGRVGEIKGKVVRIRVEKDRQLARADLPDLDLMARDLYTRFIRRNPSSTEAAIDDIAAALQQVLVDRGQDDAMKRVRRLRAWAEEL
ncbi:MAG: hypothetical protein GWP91_06720 [Rhodobacterales bacterium]|nr:hypothetical protein [Rhodobacterales bacterium]